MHIKLENGWQWDTEAGTLTSPPLKAGGHRVIEVTALSVITKDRVVGRKKDGSRLEMALECEHALAEKRHYSSAYCTVCGEALGWWCPDTPDHYCHYDEDGEICLYCGHPEERR